MIWPLFKQSIHYLLSNRLKLTMLALYGAISVSFGYSMTRMNEIEAFFRFTSLILLVFLGAGILGNEMKSGALANTYVRPIKRWHHVIARWLGLIAISAAGAFLLALVPAIHACTVWKADLVFAPFLIDLFMIACVACMIMFYSSLGPGLTDVGVYIGIFALAHLFSDTRLGRMVIPSIDYMLSAGFKDISSSYFRFGYSPSELVSFSYLGAAELAVVHLGLAVFIMTRREIGYSR